MIALILAMIMAVSHRDADTIRPWAEAISAECADASKLTCLRFAAQAAAEGGFAPYVLDGRCNDPRWLSRQRGCHIKGGWCPCDAGHAAGPWQMHFADMGLSPEDARDPVRGTAAAWAYWRRAPGAWTTRAMAYTIADRWLW